MNPDKRKHALPTWLDGRTIAMLTATITVALTLGTMIQTSHARLGGEIGQLRQDMSELGQELRQDMSELRRELGNDMNELRRELGNDIDRLDDRLRSVEIDVAAIRTAVVGLDTRLSAVEQHVHHGGEMPDSNQNDS